MFFVGILDKSLTFFFFSLLRLNEKSLPKKQRKKDLLVVSWGLLFFNV